jgi:tRNA A-37 threonylcarbamoyl transferase component Bud32
MTTDDRPPADATRAAPEDLLLGRLAVEERLITMDQLQEILREQEQVRRKGGEAPLGQLLLRRGWIRVEDLARLLKEQSRREGGLPSLPRYEIRDKIGQGATAVVYRAWDRQIGRAVALKVHRETAGAGDVARQRFRREAQAAGGLAHPHVITIYDAGEQDGRLYLVMELVEGRSLGEVLRDGRPLNDVVRLVEKAARGVAAAHARSVIHRDLKPANILVTASGEPKVGDFGLAHVADSTMELTKTGATLGTPLYMAPEQVQGRTKDVSPATDVYALGAILYEAAAGRPPFVGEGLMEIYGRIVCEEPAAPRQLNPRVSEDLQTIILRALEKDPARRYADAAEFADDLRRLLEGEPIRARPAGPFRRAAKWVRRHRTVSALAVAVLASLVAVAAVAAAGAASRARALARSLEDGRTARREYDAAARREGATAEALEALHQRVVGSYRSALHLEPGNAEARGALADIYFDAYARAERAADRPQMEVFRELTLFFDDGRFAPRLVKRGTLSVETEPPGASVTLLPPAGAPGEPRALGASPVAKLELPAGPYLLVVRKEGLPEARREIRVEWGAHREVKVGLWWVSYQQLENVYAEARTPYKRGIVLPAAPGTETDVPSVFRHDGRWYMAYTQVAVEEGVHETMLAESADLLSWKPLGKILPAGKAGWDEKVAIGTPALQDPEWGGTYELRAFDGRYWMSFLGDAQKHRKGAGAVGMAWTREPGKAAPWTRLAENPVLHVGQAGVRPFENRTLVKASVLHDEGRRTGHPFVMFYEGEDQGNQGREIAMAGSGDLIRWERLGLGSVISHGGGISGRAQVVRMGDLWVMFYFGAFWKPKAFDTFAASYDLVHWTLWTGPPLVEPSEPWDHLYAHKPWVVKHEGVVYHFYCAVGTQGRGIALATSKDFGRK